MSETKVKKKNQDYVSLKALVMMQLKNKINLNFLKNKKKAFLRLSLMLIGFIALTVAIYFVFYFASVLRIFSFSLTIPNNVLVFIFTIMMLLSIITCSFGLMKSFYFARDNQILLTFPVTKTKIFISKLIVYYINELIKSVTFILPLFIAFGAVNSLPFYYYPWLLVCLFIVALVPVALGALFSIPLMGIAIVLKKNRIVELVSVAVFIGLVTWGIVALINIIPEDINIVGSWGHFFGIFKTFGWFC
ncbi:MAG: putative ABC transporter permease subunit [Christensenellales bacterium]